MSRIESGDNAPSRIRHGEVPDTLVLEDRAALAFNALEGCVDRDHDSIPYMFVDLLSKPATMSHSCWDYGSSTGRLVDSLVLARAMTGNSEASEVEQALRGNLLSFLHEDGLSYRRRSEFSEPNANMHDQRATLLGLTTWYSAEGDERARAAADLLCGALKRISLKENDFWYFPCVEYTEHGWPSPDTLYMHTAVDPAHTNARTSTRSCGITARVAAAKRSSLPRTTSATRSTTAARTTPTEASTMEWNFATGISTAGW